MDGIKKHRLTKGERIQRIVSRGLNTKTKGMTLFEFCGVIANRMDEDNISRLDVARAIAGMKGEAVNSQMIVKSLNL